MSPVGELQTVRAVEYVRRFQTASQPFEGYGRTDGGDAVHLCIKPVLKGRPESAMHVLTEVVGAVVAGLLNVPVPEAFLVWISGSFLGAAGSPLADIEPGWAYGSRWVEGAFPAAPGLSNAGTIRNPESVAGVTVLDTLLQNGDRHGTNVLLRPDAEQPDGFELVYIDNAYSFNAGAPGSGAALSLKVPQESGLLELVTSQDMFMGYLVAAEGLPAAVPASAVEKAARLGWPVPSGYAGDVVSHFTNATAQVRSLVMSGLAAFPRCR